jgi:UDP-glucose 4-epimerase
MNNSILVTGGAGFIGSHMVDRLIKEGFDVRVLDNLSSGRLENLAHHGNSIKVIIADLKKPEEILSNIKGVNAIFHFAANPEVRVSSTNPEIHFNENIVTTFNLLEAMRKKDIKQLVFASSSSVYGEPNIIPVDENSPVKPTSVYGASKASCESLIHAYSKLYGIRAVVLRYANVIGSRLRHGIVWDFVNKLKANPKELEVLGDGTQVRSYIYINDAIEATLLAWKRSSNGFDVFNVGSEDWISVDQVAKIVIDTMKLTNVKMLHKPLAHGIGWLGDVKRVALRIDRLKDIGFKPRLGSADSIKYTTISLNEDINKIPHY